MLNGLFVKFCIIVCGILLSWVWLVGFKLMVFVEIFVCLSELSMIFFILKIGCCGLMCEFWCLFLFVGRMFVDWVFLCLVGGLCINVLDILGFLLVVCLVLFLWSSF